MSDHYTQIRVPEKHCAQMASVLSVGASKVHGLAPDLARELDTWVRRLLEMAYDGAERCPLCQSTSVRLHGDGRQAILECIDCDHAWKQLESSHSQ